MEFCNDANDYSPDCLRAYALSLPDHLEEALSTHIDDIVCNGRVCIFGVGNSAMAGDIVQQYLDETSSVNIPMVSGEMVPGWLREGDHAIIISYSGLSSEVIGCYHELRRRGCTLHCITAGGELASLCEMDSVHIIRLPEGIPSRCALGYSIGYLARLLQAMGVCTLADSLIMAADDIRAYVSRMPGCRVIEDIASKMVGTVPAIYATSDMLPIAKRWRSDLYQSCRMVAFYGEMPEFDHNEIVGWADPCEHASNLSMFVIRGPREPETIRIIVDSMVDTLREFNRDLSVICMFPGDPLIKNICGCIAGDFITARVKELMS